jgi:mRNA interferase RelE/StbE
VEIVISKSAGRALMRSNKRVLIAQKISELAVDPDSLWANVVKLQGRAGYRLRVQDWRIIFRIQDDMLHIDEIEPRGSIYEDRT